MTRLAALFAAPLLLALSSCGGTTTGSTGGGSAEGGAVSGGTGSGGAGSGGGSQGVACGKTTCAQGDVCCDETCGICVKPTGACPFVVCDNIDAAATVDCNMVPPAPVLRSCMQSFGEMADASTFGPDKTDLSVHGKVMSAGSGAREGGCMASLLKFETNATALAAQTKTLLVSDLTDSSRTWDVEYLIPGAMLPDLTGSVVDVTYHYEFGGFGPTQRRLSVVNENGASIYQGDGGDVEQLTGTPVFLGRGAALCTTMDTCGTWQRYNLSAGTGDFVTDIPHGATRSAFAAPISNGQLTEYLIVHGGYAEQTSSNTQCADWFVADVHVAVVRMR